MKTFLLAVAAAAALCGSVLAVPGHKPGSSRPHDPRPHVRPYYPPQPYPYVRPYYPAHPYYIYVNGRWVIVYPYSPYAPAPYPYGPSRFPRM